MARALATLLTLLLAGCATVASTTYKTATEERTVGEQAEDTKTAARVKKAIADAAGLGSAVSVDVFCYLGNVVLVGVAESKPAGQAVSVARGVQGVKSVQSHFEAARASRTSDLAISAKLNARIVGDGDLKVSQVDWAVVNGQVVLVGFVDREDKAARVVRHARSIDGVGAVRSFIQVRTP